MAKDGKLTEFEKSQKRREIEEELAKVFRLKKYQQTEMANKIQLLIKHEAEEILRNLELARERKLKKEEPKPDPKQCQHNELEFDNGGGSLTCVKCNLRYVVSVQHQPYFNVRILAKEKRGNGRKE